MDEKFRINNFDLLRLLAALQVALEHSMAHLSVDAWPALRAFAALFPGVPIFFFVSGFLISRSYERNPDLREYALNRVLRVYPALVVCTLVAVASVGLTGYFRGRDIPFALFAAWLAGQVSVFQFFNPEFMRGFGTGVLNGSLWTITVELQFYVILPLLYVLCGVGHPSLTRARRSLLLVIALALLAEIGRDHMDAGMRGTLAFKLLNVSFVPWIFMFLVGVLAQREFVRLHALLAGRFLPMLAIYVAVALIATRGLGLDIGNSMNPLLFVLLALTVFSAAYTHPTLSRRALRGNDVSYGIYIYHIPVVNLFIHGGRTGHERDLVAALAITVALAIASWWLVERPFLRLKRHPMNPLDASSARPGSEAIGHR